MSTLIGAGICAAGYEDYVVRQGDTFYGVADAHGTSRADMYDNNPRFDKTSANASYNSKHENALRAAGQGGLDADFLKVGDHLCVKGEGARLESRPDDVVWSESARAPANSAPLQEHKKQVSALIRLAFAANDPAIAQIETALKSVRRGNDDLALPESICEQLSAQADRIKHGKDLGRLVEALQARIEQLDSGTRFNRAASPIMLSLAKYVLSRTPFPTFENFQQEQRWVEDALRVIAQQIVEANAGAEVKNADDVLALKLPPSFVQLELGMPDGQNVTYGQFLEHIRKTESGGHRP